MASIAQQIGHRLWNKSAKVFVLLMVEFTFALAIFSAYLYIAPNFSAAEAAPVQFQVIDPNDLGLNVNISFFGAGLTIEPQTKDFVAIGMVRDSRRQIAVTYSMDTSSTPPRYAPSSLPFEGDELGANSLESTTRVVVPSCISEDTDTIAFGNRANGFNSSGGIIFATRSTTSPTQFDVFTRFYSNMPPGQSLYPYDMVCTRSMDTVYVTETSLVGAVVPFIRLNIYSKIGNAYTLKRTEDYFNGSDANEAPIGLTGSGEFYAIRSSDPNLIYIRRASTGAIVSTVNIAALGITAKQINIIKGGTRLIVSDSTCSANAGCAYAIDYSQTLGGFDVASSFNLANYSALIPAAANELGFFAVSADLPTSSSTDQPGLALGLPGYDSSFGSSFTWKPITNPYVSTETIWVPGEQLMIPFGPSLSDVMRGGGMLTSHALIADDETILVFGGPGDGSANGTSGYVFIYAEPMATTLPPIENPPPDSPYYTIPPTTPPSSFPAPQAPQSPPPVVQDYTGIFIVSNIFFWPSVAFFLVVVFVLICRRISSGPSNSSGGSGKSSKSSKKR